MLPNTFVTRPACGKVVGKTAFLQNLTTKLVEHKLTSFYTCSGRIGVGTFETKANNPIFTVRINTHCFRPKLANFSDHRRCRTKHACFLTLGSTGFRSTEALFCRGSTLTKVVRFPDK